MLELLGDTTKPLHHAYMVFGVREETLEQITEALTARNADILKLPYHQVFTFETLTVDDIPTLVMSQSAVALDNTPETIFVSMSAITSEAQHKLLKLLEEPVAGKHFFFFLPTRSGILDTILSRVHSIDIASESFDGGAFLKLSVPKRLSYVEKLIKKHKDTDTTGPLREEVRGLLDSIEVAIHTKGNVTENVATLKDILKFKAQLSDRQAPVKMILEYIAITI